MKFYCIASFDVERYANEERDDEPIGIFTIEKDSIWEMRDNPSDYEVMLDNCKDGDWLGLSKADFKRLFKRVEEK